MTLEQAAVLIARVGNVSSDPRGLLTTVATAQQLDAAEEYAHSQIRTAMRILRVHFGLETKNE